MVKVNQWSNNDSLFPKGPIHLYPIQKHKFDDTFASYVQLTKMKHKPKIKM